MTTIREFLTANAGMPRKELIDACVKEVGCGRKAVFNIINEVIPAGTPVLNREIPAPRPGIGLSESELRKKYDIRYIILTNAQKLERGTFVTEFDFVKGCNLPTNAGYRQFLEDPEFLKYKGKAGSAVYWSHPDSIAKMKTDLVLR